MTQSAIVNMYKLESFDDRCYANTNSIQVAIFLNYTEI